MLGASSSARLHEVGAVAVAKSVLDCLQQADAWKEDLAKATSLVQHLVVLSWLTFN